ncbi:NTP transferase domain-containing protein [Microcella sp.]|uniref:molybdenum cofactor guanylyltransferase n=1 Tax=Microcella sp. TaxID=1913979 RepID=UPI0033158107
MIVDALVLSGGRGARLGGASKAALEVDGDTLLQRTLVALRAARCVVVVGEAPARVLDARVCATREHPAYGGPVAAIGAGLDALEARREPTADALLILAVDMPHVAPLVPALLAALSSMPGAEAVLPHDEAHRAQPLAAIYRAAPLRRAVAELRAEGVPGAHRTASAHGDHPRGRDRAAERPAPHPLASLPLRAITAKMVVETIAAPPGSTADVDTLEDAAALGVAVPGRTEGDRTP